MKRAWRPWLLFGFAAAAVAGAMGWLTGAALRLERAEIDATRRAALEGNVRLALWRMDSALMALLAREGARPDAAYGAPSPQVDSAPDGPVGGVPPAVSFPIAPSPYIRLHFQMSADGTIQSPQPFEAVGAGASPTTPARDTAQMLERLRPRLDRSRALAALAEAGGGKLLTRAEMPSPPVPPLPPMQKGFEGQALRNSREAKARLDNRDQIQFSNFFIANNIDIVSPDVSAREAEEVGPMVAAWMGDELFLLRSVGSGAGARVQGCWLDWPAIRTWLTGEIADLLPAAELVAVRGNPADMTRALASVPVALRPGPLAFAPIGAWTPMRLSLAIAWACSIAAVGGIGLLLAGSLALGRRREAFVSAVTHELRTPLTTFRLYSEMLERGMIDDPERRAEYLATLRAEAERLGHLVENVLAFSRLEHGGADRIESIELIPWIETQRERWEERARRAGMDLKIEHAPDGDFRARASKSALEHVLFNLIDNASKHGARAGERAIRIDLTREAGRIAIGVADRGPGVDPAVARELFQPFSKSALAAAETTPGVGLGLALSRRLARQMRGGLRHDADHRPGARFVLTLPEG